jgi:hypothetical protein
MRITPQVSQATIVAVGHFNPLILRPDWLRKKDLIVGSDSEELHIEVMHAELVLLGFPWGRLHCDPNQFIVATYQEPLVTAHDFFVKCFQMLRETPIRAVGINREIHFPAGSAGRGNKKDGERSADEERWGMSRAELEKRILRLHKGGAGILKIGKALGIGTGTVQRVLMEQPRPFEVGASA